MNCNWMKMSGALVLAAGMVCSSAQAAELSSDAKSSVPKDVQQLIVVDYHAMVNSPTAMKLKDHVMPPELRRLESALVESGLDVNNDADVLTFAAFRVEGTTDADGTKHGGGTRIVGIAQGQFQTTKIMAAFAKAKTKPLMIRNNSLYPMGSSGLSVVFINQTTMIFGDKDAIRSTLDTRDGLTPSFLTNSDMMNDMALVKDGDIWSVLDQSGTQQMMRSVLGEAAQVADFTTVRDRLKSSRYLMSFQNGVKFDLNVVTSDSISGATGATLMKAAILLKKTTGTPTAAEKTALDNTTVDSNSGTMIVEFSASDSEFSTLMSSPLFQTVVK